MKAWRMMIILTLGLAVIGFIAMRESRQRAVEAIEAYGENQFSQQERFQEEAKQSQRELCTNTVGFRRTLESRVQTDGNDVSKWKGKASVEIINTVGGVEVTNLKFKFLRSFDHVSAYAIQ